MLNIKNLHVSVDDKQILNGLSLDIAPGEVHAIMGPNGSGKSTLSYTIAGKPGYDVTDGEVIYEGKSLLDLDPETRVARGLFLALQYPVEIPGVTTMTFLRTALNAQRKARDEEPLNAVQFLKLVRGLAEDLEIKEEMLKRSVNVGFSGGEKKRAEVLQMSLFAPKLAILDETDSGLDIDALKVVADGVNRLRNKERSFLVITHYQRLLDHIVPDHVHILANGRIVRSGGKELAHELEAKGYDALITEAA